MQAVPAGCGPSERNGGDALSGKTIALDCRWLGLGGAGRVTELVLASFRRSPPAGRWILWGSADRLRPLVFGGAGVRPWNGDPRARLGQRDFRAVPDADVVVYLHQIRPLRPGRSVTFILDTIPLRYGGNAAARLAKRIFFLAVARLSTRIVTISEFSRRSIIQDLGVRPDDVDVVPLPVDTARAEAIRRMRDRMSQDDVCLYVGRFDKHKNLERLCIAFADTQFAARGGRLLLVGGWPGETAAVTEWVAHRGVPGVEVRPACPEDELDRLLATSRALVVPSLEEGYGLPAFEAAACGIPVAASRTGAMTDLPADVAVPFDPLNTADISAALDAVAARPARGRPYEQEGEDIGPSLLRAVASALRPRRDVRLA